MFGNTVGGCFASQAVKIDNVDFFFAEKKGDILSDIDEALHYKVEVAGLFIWYRVQDLFNLPDGYWHGIRHNGHTPRSRAILRYLRNHVEKYA